MPYKTLIAFIIIFMLPLSLVLSILYYASILILVLFLALIMRVIFINRYIIPKIKQFLSILLQPLPENLKSDKVEGIIQSFKTAAEPFEECISFTLSDLNINDNWLYLDVDWKEMGSEIESQFNAIAKSHGINDMYTHSATFNEELSVWEALVVYDDWLKSRGYDFVLWDQGSDAYTGFICQSHLLDEMLTLGQSLNLNLTVVDHFNEQ